MSRFYYFKVFKKCLTFFYIHSIVDTATFVTESAETTGHRHNQKKNDFFTFMVKAYTIKVVCIDNARWTLSIQITYKLN